MFLKTIFSQVLQSSLFSLPEETLGEHEPCAPQTTPICSTENVQESQEERELPVQMMSTQDPVVTDVELVNSTTPEVSIPPNQQLKRLNEALEAQLKEVRRELLEAHVESKQLAQTCGTQEIALSKLEEEKSGLEKSLQQKIRECVAEAENVRDLRKKFTQLEKENAEKFARITAENERVLEAAKDDRFETCFDAEQKKIEDLKKEIASYEEQHYAWIELDTERDMLSEENQRLVTENQQLEEEVKKHQAETNAKDRVSPQTLVGLIDEVLCALKSKQEEIEHDWWNPQDYIQELESVRKKVIRECKAGDYQGMDSGSVASIIYTVYKHAKAPLEACVHETGQVQRIIDNRIHMLEQIIEVFGGVSTFEEVENKIKSMSPQNITEPGCIKPPPGLLDPKQGAEMVLYTYGIKKGQL